MIAGLRRALPAALALLLLAYIFNFLDRQILGILAGPIIADLKLTDAEFGAIGGIAFAILYSVLGVPLAMLAALLGGIGGGAAEVLWMTLLRREAGNQYVR